MNAEILERSDHELRFESLADAARALVFPCDAAGHVDMDRLSPRALCNYLYARAVVGAGFRAPCVLHCAPGQGAERQNTTPA